MKQIKRRIRIWTMAAIMAGNCLVTPAAVFGEEPVFTAGSNLAVAVSQRIDETGESSPGGMDAAAGAGGGGAEGTAAGADGGGTSGTAGTAAGADGGGASGTAGTAAGGAGTAETAGTATGADGGGAEGEVRSGTGGEAGTMEESQAGPDIQAPSAVLMEASTGQIIYEKNADEPRSPASITKIMTLILIFDALESGRIHMTDEVSTSAYAKSMGGSQVFLEEGEVQTVETLIKCIVIASGNDASVAMAEYIAGDEKTFVDMMNRRAGELGMTATHFEDCCGLTESRSHVTSARDIAVMSRELINRYPEIHNYSTIWMDTITHVTKQGTKEFGLSNTNKLLKMAVNFKVTGLKTGSTSVAKYCLSATAEKDGVRMIAAIMAAPDYKARFSDAAALLNYGYANCRLYEDKEPLSLPGMPVENGVEDTVELRYQGIFSCLGLHGENFDAVERSLMLEESLEAPVEEGQKAGVLEYRLGGKKIGELPVVTAGTVREARMADYIRKMMNGLFLKESETAGSQPGGEHAAAGDGSRTESGDGENGNSFGAGLSQT